MNKRLRIYNKYDGHCSYCGDAIHETNFEVDHLYPKNRGSGKGFTDTDDISNLMPSCFKCNRWKGSKNINSFRTSISNKYQPYVKFFDKQPIIIFHFEKI